MRRPCLEGEAQVGRARIRQHPVLFQEGRWVRLPLQEALQEAGSGGALDWIDHRTSFGGTEEARWNTNVLVNRQGRERCREGEENEEDPSQEA